MEIHQSIAFLYIFYLWGKKMLTVFSIFYQHSGLMSAKAAALNMPFVKSSRGQPVHRTSRSSARKDAIEMMRQSAISNS